MKILVINGPNLNMLGIREPAIYGRETYETLCEKIRAFAEELNVEVEIYQSNHEGDLVDKIQSAYGKAVVDENGGLTYEGAADGIVINPGAYTHTSVALLDALKAVGIPTVEVHISDTSTREDFRQISYLRAACEQTIIGHGTKGYLEAIEYLAESDLSD